MKRWNEQSPIAKMFDITYGNLTFLENPIYAMVVDDPSRGQVVSAKKSVMVVGGKFLLLLKFVTYLFKLFSYFID